MGPRTDLLRGPADGGDRSPGRPARPPAPGASSPKRCWRCGRAKPRSEFNRERGRADGLRPWCRACGNEATRAARLRDPEGQRIDRHRRYVERERPRPRRAEVAAEAGELADVRQVLAAHRAAGADFEVAWARAVGWRGPSERAVLDATEGGWRRAYEGEPATPAEAAAARLDASAFLHA